MTDEELHAAGVAYGKWTNPHSKHRRDDLAFDGGYEAGLLAERARIFDRLTELDIELHRVGNLAAKYQSKLMQLQFLCDHATKEIRRLVSAVHCPVEIRAAVESALSTIERV